MVQTKSRIHNKKRSKGQVFAVLPVLKGLGHEIEIKHLQKKWLVPNLNKNTYLLLFDFVKKLPWAILIPIFPTVMRRTIPLSHKHSYKLIPTYQHTPVFQLRPADTHTKTYGILKISSLF
jgi:hypothetical protein